MQVYVYQYTCARFETAEAFKKIPTFLDIFYEYFYFYLIF